MARLILILSLMCASAIAQNATQTGHYAKIVNGTGASPSGNGWSRVTARTDANGGVFAQLNSTSGATVEHYRTSAAFELRSGWTRTENLVTVYKWENWSMSKPCTAGQLLPVNNTGGFDPEGGKVGPGGEPVDGDGNPLETAPGHTSPVSVVNPFTKPAKPVAILTSEGQAPITIPIGVGELNPGEGRDTTIGSDLPFEWELGWDFGDGIIVDDPGNGGGTSTPVDIEITSPGTGPVTPVQPPLTSPGSGASDLEALNNINATLKAYGEAARTGNGVSNDHLSRIKELFGTAIDKLQGISDGQGETELVGESAGDLDTLADATSGEGLAGTQYNADTSGAGTAGDDNKTAEIASIRGKISTIKESLAGLGSSVVSYNQYSQSSWVFSFNALGRSYSYNLEAMAADYLDLMRAVFLYGLSLSFIWRFFTTVRSAFV